MDLIEFLTARLDEDEEVARAATQGRWMWTDPDTSGFPQGDIRLVADQGAWKTCEHCCTWHGEGNLHRGEQRTPGLHEHRVTEQVVGSWGHDAWGIDVEPGDADHIARHDPARALAEVEAKRRIVEGYRYLAADPELQRQAWTFALRCLALPYADHPDYADEWQLPR